MSHVGRLSRISALAIVIGVLAILSSPVCARADDFPSRFDLRDRGVVTPVKQQNPFGSCWAFSATAATESSILTKMGATYADTGLDLSERYLSWYVARPVTDNISTSQAGEGLHVYNTEAGPNHIYNFGGKEECAATLYAQGIGPQLESDYPYKGAAGRLAYEDLLANKNTYLSLDLATLMELYPSFNLADLKTMIEDDYDYYLDLYSKYDTYSPLDDWSIYDADEPGSGKLRGSSYTLTDNNVLTYWVRNLDTGDMEGNQHYEAEGNTAIMHYSENDAYLYQGSIDQIKSELYAGRGVSVDFSIGDNFLNGDTWAVYNPPSQQVSRHAVCIVGWDDGYAASNFTHTRKRDGTPLTDSLGNNLSDDEARALTTPPKDGAWICKNSWGSETDKISGGLVASNGETKDANAYDWGIVDESGLHTGYFYLSYYDASIGIPESYDFDIRENHDQENALQVDYLPASAGEWRHNSLSSMWEANVFTLDKDMRIDSVATRVRSSDKAPLSGFDVTFDLYKLNEGATAPDDGLHLASCTRQFTCEGYHRTQLDSPVYLKAGDRLGIVVQQSHTFGDGTTRYCVSAQETLGYRSNPNWRLYPVWGTPVVNAGESYWKEEGVTDKEEGAVDGWLDMTQPLSYDLGAYLNPEQWSFYGSWYTGTPFNDFYAMDNFCIKAFGEPCTLEHVDAADASCETAGNAPYWRDPQTGATFSDENGLAAAGNVETAALGHDWGQGVVTREPTTTEEGILTFTCSHCGATREEPIPVKGVTLRFELDGGALNGSTDALVMTAKVGDTIRIPDAPTRDGHAFRYWRGSEYHPGDEYAVTGDHTFTAVWTQDDTKAGKGALSHLSLARTGDSLAYVAVAGLMAATVGGLVAYRLRKKA